MTSPVFSKGNTAVVTGGASGIGRALVEHCLRNGMTVLVADRDEAALNGAFGIPQSGPGVVHTYAMDVASQADWETLKGRVDKEFGGKLNLLALNAGVGSPSSWDSPASFHAVLDVNLFGVLNGIAALLPAVRAAATSLSSPASAPHAAIVITGSKQGITNPPGNPAYNASKAAVRTTAEHLSYDLRDAGVGVHLLVPGWTHTGMTGGGSGGKPKPAGAWEPAQVVGVLAERMGRNEFYVVCPDNDVSEAMDRRRMLWGVGDIVERRPPLSRWREEWKGEAQAWMDEK